MTLSKPSGTYWRCSCKASVKGCRRASGGSQTGGVAPALLRLRQAEEAARGRIGHLHAALRIDHQDRLGKGVDRGLARPLGADQLGLVRLTEFAELAGHRIEGRSKLPQLVVGSDRHDLVEIAGPDGHGRFRHRADRINDHPDRVAHEKHGQHDAARQAQAVPDQRGAGQAFRLRRRHPSCSSHSDGGCRRKRS